MDIIDLTDLIDIIEPYRDSLDLRNLIEFHRFFRPCWL